MLAEGLVLAPDCTPCSLQSRGWKAIWPGMLLLATMLFYLLSWSAVLVKHPPLDFSLYVMFQEMLFDVRTCLSFCNNIPWVWMDCEGREAHSVEVEGRGNAEDNKEGERSGSCVGGS